MLIMPEKNRLLLPDQLHTKLSWSFPCKR